MSRRRELARRLAALDDIAGILSAMKSLALMETRILGGLMSSQRRMVAGIEAAAADFLVWHPGLVPASARQHELCVLVGSEQGFCGDFNDAVVARIEALCIDAQAPARWVVVGRRLSARLAGDPRAALSLPGATVADEVPAVLLQLTGELNRQLATETLAGYGLSTLYHDDASGDIHLRRLLPLRDLSAPGVQASYAAELNLPPANFLAGLTRHYLHAALNEALYSSLMAENRQREAHMERALHRLEEDTGRLRLAYNAQRQEDITEEIEIILLSADMLAGERTGP